MGKINLLDSSVFNMLAAGEVVSGPSSVVKELVENSIDAGATAIDIRIEEGGLRKISVSDNGIGIQPDDMRRAFLPHATSKISRITDLDSLSTLGFRGEALASIASVSEVTAESRSRGADSASKLHLSGGKVLSEMPSMRAEGTAIEVDDLFFNTPARLKFLKKSSLEQRAVEDVVKSLAIANPELNITLKNEDETLVSSSGGELIDAICAVFGVKNASQLLKIEQPDPGDIKVRGYVSSPDNTKATRAFQYIIINGRTVEDKTIRTAAEKAYGNYLMKRAFPMFVLDIVMPFEEVDVNVHPAKAEVRFIDSHKVFSAVYHAVYETVNRAVMGDKKSFDLSSDTQQADDGYVQRTEKTFTQPRIDTSLLFRPKIQRSAGSDYDIMLLRGELKDSPVPFYDRQQSRPADEECEAEPVAVFDGKIVGQLFATYLIVERDDKAYIIDQHAAHERVLYDKIKSALSAEYSQKLLIPFRLNMSAAEEEYFDKVKDKLCEMGFEFQLNGGNYFATAVPEPVTRVNITTFFGGLFENMLDEEELTLGDMLKDTLCQQACKAAIKGGETLNREQIERVIRNYVNEKGELPDKCPHGRPAVIEISKKDIEKLFKRIV